MTTRLELDPEPFACYESEVKFGGSVIRHEREHEGYVYFEPRVGYEQADAFYPSHIWGPEDEN